MGGYIYFWLFELEKKRKTLKEFGLSWEMKPPLPPTVPSCNNVVFCHFIVQFFFTVDRRSLLAQLKDFVASQRPLIILIHIIYAIPPNWPRGTNWQRIPNFSMMPSIIVAVFIWMAFGMEMHITRLLWTQAHADNQHPPIGSVLLVVLLVLSSTVSFTIMSVYFFNPRNRFHHSSSKIIPGFEFAPLGEQQDVQPNKTDWMGANFFLIFAITGLGVAPMLFKSTSSSVSLIYTNLQLK